MRRHGKRLFAALLAAVLLLGAFPASGAETEPDETLPEESNGYIFALRADAPMLFQLEETSGVEPISAAHGVYWAETMEEIEALFPTELLEYVTPDYAMESHAAPNDPDYVNNKAWSLKMVNMDYAWENNITGAGVRVGIVDSGVRRTHEDLADADIKPGTFYPPGYPASYPEGDDTDSKPGSEDPADPNSPTRPQNAHGTFVAGLIAAVPNNGKGMAGVSPGVELIPLTAFEERITYLSAVCKAIYGGVDDYQCDVLNMSLGIYKDKPLDSGNLPDITPLDNAIAYAQSKGVVLVASVGNDSGTMLSYPAAYEGVIGVGAVDKSEERAGLSQYNKSVDLMAPGSSVYSLAWNSDTDYSIGSGTSYAAPQVAAAAALALEMDPSLMPERLEALLTATAKDLGKVGRDDEYGYGLLDVSAFLEAVAKPWASVQAAPGGVELSAHYCGKAAGKPVTVWAAAYDADGRMVASASREVVVPADGMVKAGELYLDTTADATQAKVFLWDSATGAPLDESVTLTLSK